MGGALAALEMRKDPETMTTKWRELDASDLSRISGGGLFDWFSGSIPMPQQTIPKLTPADQLPLHFPGTQYNEGDPMPPANPPNIHDAAGQEINPDPWAYDSHGNTQYQGEHSDAVPNPDIPDHSQDWFGFTPSSPGDRMDNQMELLGNPNNWSDPSGMTTASADGSYDNGSWDTASAGDSWGSDSWGSDSDFG
jgi:hypothetical protein